MSRLIQLGKDSLVYGLGGILAKGLSFLLLPVYTRIFTPADYGTIEMLTVLSSFFASLLVMGMDSAQSMYFFKVKEEGRVAQARIVSAILQWRLIWGGCITLLSTLMAPLLNAWFFEGQLSWGYFAIAFVGALFTQVMSQSAEVMRLLYRPWGYIGIILAQSVLAASLVLAFVLLLNQGILGFFLGAAIASFIVAIIGWFHIRAFWKFDQIHWDLWPQLIRFGVPLVPAGVAIYFMSTADRWFVQYYHGAEALGLFAVGAKFSLLLLLAVDTFRKAWWPIAMHAMHSSDGPETFRMISRLYMGLACAGIVVLTYLSPWLVQWLTGPDYHGAWPIVGILAWQAVFYGFFLIASAGIWKVEKTYLNLPLMAGAAVLGLVLNWFLVPDYGGMGAALATALTYLVWVTAALIISERLWNVGFQFSVMSMQISSTIGFVIGFIFFGRGDMSGMTFIVATILVVNLIFFSVAKKDRITIRQRIWPIHSA
ncbi:oligosaccharide flippase family protein [Sedimenticola selenatireducens]|uniref:lipopolysaccharide biosynthesis protein n=1 Tax=Sedimenticola selenatireducens TaxID=191960 RepID=UPI002AABBD53|nr:oligosaccharide flippase family protein [Sedimenticola selenatireducens]